MADYQAQIVIGLDDIWAVVTETRDTVRDMKTKLDNVVDDSADHETRIRALESLVWKAAGIATGAGALIGVLMDRLFG